MSGQRKSQTESLQTRGWFLICFGASRTWLPTLIPLPSWGLHMSSATRVLWILHCIKPSRTPLSPSVLAWVTQPHRLCWSVSDPFLSCMLLPKSFSIYLEYLLYARHICYVPGAQHWTDHTSWCRAHTLCSMQDLLLCS